MFKSMKTGVLAAILISTALIANAQKKVTEGTVTYSFDSEQGKMDQSLAFNGEVSKMSIDAGPAKIEVLSDAKDNTGLVLVSVPVQQMQKAAKMTSADMDKQDADQGVSKPTDVKATGEKQTIAGYNAEKYTYKDEAGGTYEVWVTTELELPANLFTKLFKSQVKGTVVKVTNKTGSLLLKSFKEEKVGALSTSTIPTGYDTITYAELRAMQGGGGE